MLNARDTSLALRGVLLVGADPTGAELMQVRLASDVLSSELPGVALLHASCVEDALAALRDSAIDVVVLDLPRREVGGLDALHSMLADAPWVPVVVLVASDGEWLGLEALRAGAQDYVLEPFPEGPAFARLLRNACERHRLLEQRDTAVRFSDTAARRWRLLAEVSKALDAVGDPSAAIDEMARIIVPDAADCFALLLTGDDELPTMVEIRHNGGLPGELRSRIHELVTSARVGDGRRSESADEADVGALHEAARLVFVSLGVVRGTAVPVRFAGRVRGLLLLAAMAGRQDALTDAKLGQSLAEGLAHALEKTLLLQLMHRAIAGRDRAVSIVSHDLINPLSTIQICATALLDPAPAPSGAVRPMAELIQRSAAWMREIIEDLLDRARLDGGRVVLNRQPTGVSDVITAAHTLFEPVARDHAIEFVVYSASQLPDVDADRHRLLQVLSNLIGNAMKFTPAGGRVALSARLAGTEQPASRSVGHGGAVQFAVTDTGPGIPREELAHVFDWFWHAPRGRGSSGTGSGLGLAIAKGLIEAHHSQLHVDSTLGTGSTFWFTIPAVTGGPHEHGATGW